MWQQMQPIVAKISKQWTSNNSMRFGMMVLLGFLGIIGDTNAASLQSTKPHSINSTQSISPPNLQNLKTKLELFHAKYDATLLNSTFLPFLKDCNENFDKIPEKMSYTDRLCITYYDMVNSIYHLNEFEDADSVTKILEEYNAKSMTDNFCMEFPGEITARLEEQPFMAATNITNWLTINDCVISCMDSNKMISNWHILDICKLISGGLSMALNKSKVETKITPRRDASTPKNNNINNNNTNAVIGPIIKAVTDEHTNAVAPTKIQEKTVETPQEKLNAVEPVQSTEGDKQLKNPNAADGEESEQINEQKLESESRNYDNDDTADETENHSENGQHETPLQTNSNNLQSELSANINEFREDNESSFFSYFMFLMFVIITIYVAYHNKSKILALLIEGRRGRTYSSRGGSRRKSHSAEYRKLDCNLEEAIQSGGSQKLSSQIIY